MNDPRFYSVHGLRLQCDFPLPLPPSPEGRPDITVTDHGFMPPDLSSPLPAYIQTQWVRDESGSCLRYRNFLGDLLEYRFSADGRSIRTRRTRLDIDMTGITLGTALGAALFLRGVPALHGTAVVINGRAALIAGNSGSGKSTLASALIACGMPLLTDDLAAFSCKGDGVVAQPGFPRMKLFPESGMVVGMTADSWPRIMEHHSSDDKRWLDAGTLPGGFCPEARPVAAIYLLEGRDAGLGGARIAPLSPRDACIALTGYFHCARYTDLSPATKLDWAVRLAGRVPVRRLLMPEGLDTVHTSARVVIQDMTFC